jgi:hypothetical protein
VKKQDFCTIMYVVEYIFLIFFLEEGSEAFVSGTDDEVEKDSRYEKKIQSRQNQSILICYPKQGLDLETITMNFLYEIQVC